MIINLAIIYKKKNLLTMYHQNICGLSNNINELITFLHPHFPDIKLITEHQLKQAQLELTYLTITTLVLDTADNIQGRVE